MAIHSPGRGVLALLAASLLAGCQAAPTVYHNPNADLSVIRRVAILPLENLSTDRFAGERIRELLTVELLATSPFDVAEPTQVNRALSAVKVTDVREMKGEELAALGENLGAEAFLMGTVMDFRERRSGSVNMPEVAVSLRLVDAQSGLPIWSTKEIRNGVSIWTRLFGVGEQSVTQAAETVVREALATLY